MSLLEKVDSILEEMEKINGKLDRLLASGGDKIKCGNCGKMFKAYHDGQGINTGYCPKCLTEYDTVGLDEKPPVIEKTIIKGGTTIPRKGQGRYEWFPVKGLEKVKVRACSNEGCPYYLKYSEEKGKYEHWKYDPNTQEGGFVQDNCDYYFPEGL